MKLQFFGAAQMVTGSCYLLETGGTKVLIDCGLYQGGKDIKERNYQKFLFKPSELNYVLLTHAHTDHSGLVPKLFKEGYKGAVLATQATLDLCRIMLPDSGHIQEMEVERKNRRRARVGEPPLSPIYTVEEAVGCIKHFKGYDYNQEISLTDNLRIRFQDAGHILGSSIIEVWVKEGDIEQKLVFSGDIGNQNQPYIQDPACLNEAGYVIMESTYGNRLHDDTQDKLAKLKEIVNATFQRGGNLIIP
ncbi:MAG TPA: MBL fold metallo-hydrolase, partial [Verrucomicrobiae bacterium]|nr:MBL fold metallo-hydrolase [Verrucomicrobiae bacterium]